jgi:hypothetical protein
MGRWRLVIRHGSQVQREDFDDLDAAIAAMERHANAIAAEGPLDQISGFREYDPGDRVHARLELSSGGRLRGREAGIDVMGDGALIPYTGLIRRHKLNSSCGESAFEAVREELT